MTERHTSPLIPEAMTAGRPIVASDLPSSREVLRTARTRCSCLRVTPPRLDAALRRVLSDVGFARRLAGAAWTRPRDTLGRAGPRRCAPCSRSWGERPAPRGGAPVGWTAGPRAALHPHSPYGDAEDPRADEIEYFSYLRSLVFDHDVSSATSTSGSAADPKGLAGFKSTFLDLRRPTPAATSTSPPRLRAVVALLPPGPRGRARRARLGARVAADGFSWPYVAAVCYASALYGLAGLLLVHDALRRHGGMREPAATLAVAGLWLGTPLLYYMTLAPAFSHGPGVFAVALLVWLSLRAAARPPGGIWEWAAIGAAGGLAALVREQDGLFLIIPAGLLLYQWQKGVGSGDRPGGRDGGAVVWPGAQRFAYCALTALGPSRLVNAR
jgi:hypothetical protein